MSKWQKIVENILKENNIVLNEVKQVGLLYHNTPNSIEILIENIAKLDEDAEKDYRLIKEAEIVWNEFLNKIKENKESIVNQ